MHAGNLPGYPASHGCIRLPSAFANVCLYGVTQLGTPVMITDDEQIRKDAERQRMAAEYERRHRRNCPTEGVWLSGGRLERALAEL